MTADIFLLLLIGLLVSPNIFGEPVHLNDHSVQCYDKDCPNATIACKRDIKTSSNKKSLNTLIYCLDSNDAVLNQFSESVPNPYGPSLTFQSSSYSRTHGSTGNNQPFEINWAKPQIEDFTRS